MPTLRRLLLLKEYSSLTPEEQTLYRSYKNRVVSLVEYSKNPVRAEWSFPFEIFHNLTLENLVFKELHGFYRSLFDVTSYYQHNTAGMAKFVNALISKLGPSENLVTELHLRQLPLKILKDPAYKWIGTDDDDVTTDVVNRVNGNLIFLEFKFRVDSGCTAGRREVWETKFLKIIQHIVTGKKLFVKGSAQHSLIEVLRRAGINVIELYIGILFDIKGNPATVGEDQKFICYGGMQEGYQRILAYLNQSNVQYKEPEPTDSSTEAFLLEFDLSDVKVKVGAKYANSAIDSLFKGKGKDLATVKTIIDLLIYDDLWLSQLLAISERSLLLTHEKNYLLVIEDLLRSEPNIRKKAELFSEIRHSREKDALNILTDITRLIITNYKTRFEIMPTPIMLQLMQAYVKGYNIEDYVADIIQILLVVNLKSLIPAKKFMLEEFL